MPIHLRGMFMLLIILTAFLVRADDDDMCTMFSDTCSDCLSMYPDCSWCNDDDPANPGSKVGCHNMTSTATTTCKINEYHAIDALTAPNCCVDSTGCSDCTTMSYCNYCWDSSSGDVCLPNAEGATTFTCPGGSIDVNTCCHQFSGDCDKCTKGACRWCVKDGKESCVELSNPSCKKKYATCCGTTGHTTCPMCFGDIHAIDPTSPPCVWCESTDKCIHTDLVDTCDVPNPIGPNYCEDSCFAHKNCKTCTSNPRCVWLAKVHWDEFSTDPLLAGNAFCVAGSPFGPSKEYLDFKNRYYFSPASFYWGSCEVSAHTIRAILITIVIALIMLILVIICSMFAVSTLYARRKVARQEKRRQRLRDDIEEADRMLVDDNEDADAVLFDEVAWFTEDEEQ
ncbi:Plexin repeat protein [Carpediemonas membranifera]|uniref:Plexin repeat protein n=1 Tax=Carpediemonas membranifera TaxID=201153 RepID=A0A8J6B926_9EUKA|nr:Plexin repeat protein [Carpediemonas membranifera]|eukprot:KAG9395297.1 Plexin repeat protein [Carpediemonas membranifera]